MTKFEFIAICEENEIAPSIALENENVVQALETRNDELVKTIIETEF